MRKLIVVLALGLAWCGVSEAVDGGDRSAAQMATIGYTTSAVNVSTGNPLILYQVVLATGASGEFCVLFDSGSAVGLTAAGGGATQRYRLYYSSNVLLENRSFVFDPPVQFNEGIVAFNSAATGFATLIYNYGRK